MSRFKEKLEKLIMFNKIEQAINDLFQAFNDYNQDDYEIRDLKRQLIMLSSSWHDINEKKIIDTLSFEDYNKNKNKITNSLLSLIDGLPNYPNFNNFITKNEKPKSSSIPSIFTSATESPFPVLLWREHNSIEDIEEINDTIRLPSIMNIEESIHYLQQLIPPNSVLTKFKIFGDEIEEIIKNYDITGFFGFEKSSDLLDSILKYSDDIEKMILKVKQNPYNIELKNRAILPKFTIINKGDLPAINIVIIIEESDYCSYFTSVMLNERNIVMPTERPKHIQAIIDFLENYEKIKKISKKRAALNKELFISGKMSGDNISYKYPNELLLRKHSIKIENRNIRLDFNGSIKPGFYEEINFENIFIASNLKKGEKGSLKYWCYADNLKQKIEGNLIIHGK